MPNWSAKMLFTAEDAIVFNSARILLLLNVLEKRKDVDLEKLNYYDFFSANPFHMISKEEPEYLSLELVGMKSFTINYINSSQRFQTKRALLKHYLAILVGKELVDVFNQDGKITFQITDKGGAIAKSIQSMYADAYQTSAKIITKKLNSFSNTKLSKFAAMKIEGKTFQMDLYDMVDEAHETNSS